MERNVTNELIILLLKAVKAFVREDKVLLIDHLIVSQNGYFSFKEHKIF